MSAKVISVRFTSAWRKRPFDFLCIIFLFILVFSIFSFLSVFFGYDFDEGRTSAASFRSVRKDVIPRIITNPSEPFGVDVEECLREGYLMDYPMSGLEQELRRIYAMVDGVMKKLNITYWPADATLLGILRHGRVANDRDLDFHVLTTVETCDSVLRSLFTEFSALEKTLYSRIARKKRGNQKGMTMYFMVRFFKKFGSSNTGADFACVFKHSNGSLAVFNHFSKLMILPNNTLPLIRCRIYDMTVQCPGSGYHILAAFKPRYDGCVVFPHCFGDPGNPHKRCLTPHTPVSLKSFVNATLALKRCGYGNLADHLQTHPLCVKMITERENMDCCNPSLRTILNGKDYWFLQRFNG